MLQFTTAIDLKSDSNSLCAKSVILSYQLQSETLLIQRYRFFYIFQFTDLFS